MPSSPDAPERLRTANLSKTYAMAGQSLTVLDQVSFTLRAGETCAIVGPSGSGKSTLLGLCAGLDQPSAGQVLIDGVDLASLNEDGRARLRNRLTGFVFQSFQLLATLTALENVMTPLELAGQGQAEERAVALLAQVGLKDRLGHYPSQLSGGEQQRVALARAFVNDPRLLFADEPTGNLDNETGKKVVDLLFDLHRRQHSTLLIVTHDLELAKRADRQIRLHNGQVVEDLQR
jgi:putative ABC transport system ATP-binding protein